MEKILEVKDLTKYYAKTLGVKDVNFSLNKGEILGFIGSNGAGKSTTIRSILNLINKTKGEVKLFGKQFNEKDIEIKEKIGYLPGEIFLYEDLTVKQIFDYHSSFYKKDISKRRKELVIKLKLDENKKIEDLSLGNLKKVGIVLSLMHSPEILILDEPTSGLDPIMQSVFYEIIKEEKQKGTSIIYSTHILSEVSKICDRIAIIKDNSLLKIDTVDNIKNNELNFVTITSNDIEKIKKENEFDIILNENNTIKFKNNKSYNELIKILSKYNIEKLLVEDATLEDLLLHYYK